MLEDPLQKKQQWVDLDNQVILLPQFVLAPGHMAQDGRILLESQDLLILELVEILLVVGLRGGLNIPVSQNLQEMLSFDVPFLSDIQSPFSHLRHH